VSGDRTERLLPIMQFLLTSFLSNDVSGPKIITKNPLWDLLCAGVISEKVKVSLILASRLGSLIILKIVIRYLNLKKPINTI